MKFYNHRASLMGVLIAFLSLPMGSSSAQEQLHDPSNITYLQSISSKASLTADELAQARQAMLKINNEARLNSEYRKQKKARNDLELPSGLTALVLSDKLSAAAQEQAESKAGARRIANEAVPGAMATGVAASLADFPIGWQTSESTYRPTWNLGGMPVDSVGFGMAKNAQSGQWHVVAIWADLGGAAVKESGLHDPQNVKILTSVNDKASLTAQELQSVREAMLRINNEGRANPEYRKKTGGTKDLDLPPRLPPLVLDEAANKAAQAQADYQASIGTMTHDNRNYRDYDDRMTKFNVAGALEACGYSSSLKDFPMGWMTGDTHHRPTWNIDIPVRRVGYGVAKSARTGQWFATAIWLPIDANDKLAAAPQAQPTPPQPPQSPVKPAGPTVRAPAAADSQWAANTRKLTKTPPRSGRNWIPADLKTVDGNKPHGVEYFELTQPAGTIQAALTKGGVMYRGDVIGSPEGHYRLTIDFNGALSIVDTKGQVKWSAGEGGTHVEFQASDGNVCLYDNQKNWKWGTQTFGPNVVEGSLRLTDDGVLEQLDKDGKPVWASE